MGNEVQKITCARSSWFPEARDLIQRSEKTTEAALTWIENQIRSGEILLYQVFDAGAFIGIFTGYVEREFGQPSNFLVVHAVSIEQQKKPFIITLYSVIGDLVKRSGLKSWTVRSQRAGMDRRLSSYGFKKLETIYKTEVQ